jgi:hypothetical protein
MRCGFERLIEFAARREARRLTMTTNAAFKGKARKLFDLAR